MPVEGGDDLARRLRAMAQKVPTRVRDQVLPEIGADLLERAKELAPRATGELIASGFVEAGPDGLAVGFAAAHALVVHEDMDARHASGGAKFLERPLFDAESDLQRKIADAVNREVS